MAGMKPELTTPQAPSNIVEILIFFLQYRQNLVRTNQRTQSLQFALCLRDEQGLILSWLDQRAAPQLEEFGPQFRTRRADPENEWAVLRECPTCIGAGWEATAGCRGVLENSTVHCTYINQNAN